MENPGPTNTNQADRGRVMTGRVRGEGRGEKEEKKQKGETWEVMTLGGQGS